MALEKRIKDELASAYKVPEDRCEAYNQAYSEKVLPLIQEKFLAHLISAVEDLIYEKMRKDNPKVSPYRILLRKNNPTNGKAVLRMSNVGAVISYNPQNDPRDLRIFTAHELGHLLCLHGILEGGCTENNADLFAYFAINGKNTFYKEKASGMIYEGGELQIISNIRAACPVTQENQSRCGL